MPWSAGFYQRSNGFFTGATVWTQDAAVPVNITASRHDTHDQDIATGLNNCVTIDGLNKPAATIVPSADATYALGSTAARWTNLYLSSTAFLFNGATNSVGLIAGTLTASRTATFPDATGNVVLDSATQTLTNKTMGAGVTLGTALIAGSGITLTGTANPLISTNTITISSGAGSGVTSAAFAAASGDVVITGTNPNTSTGTTTIGLGTVSVSHGGSGAATFTAHGLLVGEGTSAFNALASMTNGQIAIGSTGADPVPGTITAGSGITVTNGAGSITIATSSGAGTLSAGTTNTLNPVSTGTTTTQAHGLGGTPFLVVAWLECISAELNYSVGNRIYLGTDGNSSQAINIEADATNTSIIVTGTAPQVLDKSNAGRPTTAITLAKWKIVAIPYKLN